MIATTFKMNGKDFSPYVHYYSPSTGASFIKGLSDKYTLDGTLHDDVIAIKDGHTFALNPVTESEMRLIAAEYKAANVYVTLYNAETGADKTVLCRPSPMTRKPALVKQGVITYWQLGDLVFTER